MVFEKANQEFRICTKYQAYDGATISRNLLKVSSVTEWTEKFLSLWTCFMVVTITDVTSDQEYETNLLCQTQLDIWDWQLTLERMTAETIDITALAHETST